MTITFGGGRSVGTLNADRTFRSNTGNTSKTQVYSYTIPAGTLKALSKLRIEHAWTGTGTAGAKTLTIEIGGVAYYAYPAANTTLSVALAVTTMFVLDPASSQIGGAGITHAVGATAGSGSLPTSSLDLSTAI